MCGVAEGKEIDGIEHIGLARPVLTDKAVDIRRECEAGFSYVSYPSTYWDVYGEKGMPLRTTVSEMGPLLLPEELPAGAYRSLTDEELHDLKAAAGMEG